MTPPATDGAGGNVGFVLMTDPVPTVAFCVPELLYLVRNSPQRWFQYELTSHYTESMTKHSSSIMSVCTKLYNSWLLNKRGVVLVLSFQLLLLLFCSWGTKGTG